MVEVEPRADQLLIFDSRLDHEVLPMAEAKAGGGKEEEEGQAAAASGQHALRDDAVVSGPRAAARPVGALNEAACDGPRV